MEAIQGAVAASAGGRKGGQGHQSWVLKVGWRVPREARAGLEGKECATVLWLEDRLPSGGMDRSVRVLAAPLLALLAHGCSSTGCWVTVVWPTYWALFSVFSASPLPLCRVSEPLSLSTVQSCRTEAQRPLCCSVQHLLGRGAGSAVSEPRTKALPESTCN